MKRILLTLFLAVLLVLPMALPGYAATVEPVMPMIVDDPNIINGYTIACPGCGLFTFSHAASYPEVSESYTLICSYAPDYLHAHTHYRTYYVYTCHECGHTKDYFVKMFTVCPYENSGLIVMEDD